MRFPFFVVSIAFAGAACAVGPRVVVPTSEAPRTASSVVDADVDAEAQGSVALDAGDADADADGAGADASVVEVPPPRREPTPRMRDALAGYAKKLVDRAGTCAVVASTVQGTTIYAAAGGCGPNGVTPTEDSLFEIASISKVFTASLLSLLVEEGHARWDEPIGALFPPSVTLSPGVRTIPLRSLTTHLSGLPRMPTNWVIHDRSSTTAAYGKSDLFAFLASYTPKRAPGLRWEYSNLAPGLLGEGLAQREKTSYEALLRRQILGPLELFGTIVTMTSSFLPRLAPAEGDDGQPVPPRRYTPTLAGCCAIHSSARDLSRFLAAHLGDAPEPMARAFAATHVVQRDIRPDEHPVLGGMRQALGWIENKGILWHGGLTTGYQTFIALDETQKRSVVVLRNRSDEALVTGTGFAMIADLALVPR